MIRSTALAVLAWALVACAPMAYSPYQLQTTMLREAGEYQATVGNSNVTAAVSVAPNVLLHGGGHYQALNFTTFNGPREESRQWLAEGGLGMFGDFGHRDVRWTVLAGGGAGAAWSEVIEGTSNRSYEGRFARGYLQPNIGWVTPIFEIVGSVRLAGVQYMDFNSTGYGENGRSTFGLTPENMQGRLWFFLEPSVTVKVGYRWVKLFAQPVLSVPLNREEISHLPLNLVVGLSFDLAQWHGDWSF